MMRRVNLVTFVCLCTTVICRVSSLEISWDKKLNDDLEISPYTEYQKTLWYRKPRYSVSSARNYGNLEIAGSSASRIQDYSRLRSIDPYNLNLGYNGYNRPARSRDNSYYYSQASSALEDDPYENMNSFGDRSLRDMNHYPSVGRSWSGSNDRKLHDEDSYDRYDSEIGLYETDGTDDPYRSKGYKIEEEYKAQPRTRGRKIYVVPRGDSKKYYPYLGDPEVHESNSRTDNFNVDKELEEVVKKAVTLAKIQGTRETDDNHNFKDASERFNNYEEKIDRVTSTEPFRNSDIVYTPEVKHNPYDLLVNRHHVPTVNIGSRDLNYEVLSKNHKLNDDDLNLAEMIRIGKANQERDFTLADDVTFGDVHKREYPEEVVVPDDNMEDDDDVIEDMPNVAFGEDVAPVGPEITLADSKEDFNGKLGEDASDDVLEGDVVLGEAMEEDELEGRTLGELSMTADDSSLKNNESKLIEYSSIAEVSAKGTDE